MMQQNAQACPPRAASAAAGRRGGVTPRTRLSQSGPTHGRSRPRSASKWHLEGLRANPAHLRGHCCLVCLRPVGAAGGLLDGHSLRPGFNRGRILPSKENALAVCAASDRPIDSPGTQKQKGIPSYLGRISICGTSLTPTAVREGGEQTTSLSSAHSAEMYSRRTNLNAESIGVL